MDSLLGPRGTYLNGISPRDARDIAREKLASDRQLHTDGLSLKKYDRAWEKAVNRDIATPA